MKTYFKFLFNVIFIGVSFGFIGPYLISAKDDLFVFSGIIYMTTIAPTISYYFNKYFFEKQINKILTVTNANSKGD